MVRKQLIALGAFAAFAASASAHDITIDDTPFVSMKTRAEVRAELLQARAEGYEGITEIDLSPTMAAASPSRLTRSEVHAQLDHGMRFAALYLPG